MATAEQTAELEADVNGESFEHEVDKKVADGARSPELVEMLLDYSLPARPWEETPTAVNPFRGPMELQFWPWNRAANALIRRQDPEGALEIWSAMYLVLLSLQQQFHHRYPKGTALCNIGVALGKIKGRRQAQV